jgi:hypothetical protein
MRKRFSGEAELAPALRLLERVLAAYPRAFDLLLADAYYAVAPFLNFLLEHGKQAVVVLKDERRDAYEDAFRAFSEVCSVMRMVTNRGKR